MFRGQFSRSLYRHECREGPGPLGTYGVEVMSTRPTLGQRTIFLIFLYTSSLPVIDPIHYSSKDFPDTMGPV